ncbi:MAG TPA: hypothetical protein VEY30_14050 [Myxococcaceae bacterium]|nr:hypothetical protein [Myxococcaceae bacterium]
MLALGEGGAWKGGLAVWQGALWVAVQAPPVSTAELELRLSFPTGGLAARPYRVRLTPGGARAGAGVDAAPAWALRQIRSAVRRGPPGSTFEALIPAKALPRFPASGPMELELCAAVPESSETSAVGCSSGGLLVRARLPETFRQGLKLPFPPQVTGLEGRPEGWTGYRDGLLPLWVQASQKLNASRLAGLVAEKTVRLEEFGLVVSGRAVSPDGKPLVPVLVGHNPFSDDGACSGDEQLRLGLYRVDGATARQVLEFPAAACALGRASSLMLDGEGELRLAYGNGRVMTFIWSEDHFERTEYGKR